MLPVFSGRETTCPAPEEITTRASLEAFKLRFDVFPHRLHHCVCPCAHRVSHTYTSFYAASASRASSVGIDTSVRRGRPFAHVDGRQSVGAAERHASLAGGGDVLGLCESDVGGDKGLVHVRVDAEASSRAEGLGDGGPVTGTIGGEGVVHDYHEVLIGGVALDSVIRLLSPSLRGTEGVASPRYRFVDELYPHDGVAVFFGAVFLGHGC